MTRAQLEHAIRASGAISGDRELYVVGSQAILAAYPDAPAELRRSMEVDIAPRNRPELEAVIEGSIGELSSFHQTFGFYVDGVDIAGIVLPNGWEDRTVLVDNANTNGFRGICLHPGDLAVSKLAASREKDLDYVRVMLLESIVSPDLLRARIQEVPGLDADRRTQMLQWVDRLSRFRAATGSG